MKIILLIENCFKKSHFTYKFVDAFLKIPKKLINHSNWRRFQCRKSVRNWKHKYCIFHTYVLEYIKKYSKWVFHEVKLNDANEKNRETAILCLKIATINYQFFNKTFLFWNTFCMKNDSKLLFKFLCKLRFIQKT